jgi:hypothetical protein
MGRPGRQLAEKHDDPARQAVISEWDRWASRRLPTGYKATSEDEMRFFGHMQKDCPHLLPDGMGDPWQAVHGWLLLERRVRDQVGATGTTRRGNGEMLPNASSTTGTGENGPQLIPPQS